GPAMYCPKSITFTPSRGSSERATFFIVSPIFYWLDLP
ncbi:MAG: hypothetical protein ACI88A_004828, partial [Paraglaciecola sp.]